jgi:hypothetical protein
VVNSNEKGKRGEREWSHYLEDHGFAARRGQQYCGGTDSPDVICEDLAEYHFEVKFSERLSLWRAIEKAGLDGGIDKVPVVVHRANYKPWVVIMLASDWLRERRKS